MGANFRKLGRTAQRTSHWAKGLLATGAVFLAFFGAVALAQGSGPTGTAYAATPEPCSTQEPQVSAQQLGHEPSVSVTPNLGPSGSSATIHVYNFLPNQDVNAIFRVAGDPVVARGKTDANGEAYLTFTVPTAPDGSYYILAAQDNRTCVHASTRFQIGPAPTPRPNPPTATPTPAASATPIAPTATPTKPAVLPTPVLPSTGTGPDSGSGLHVNLFLALIALVVTASGFAVLGLSGSRRK
ncbi:MAG: hypothetical protein ABI782_03145 [Anaerolineaceae bacterium]